MNATPHGIAQAMDRAHCASMLLFVFVLLLAGSVCPQVALADEELSRVHVECAELDAERRAAVEARQLGELKTRGGAPGVLRLSCQASLVRGTWTVSGSIIAERSLSRSADEDPTELLHWLAVMLLETREERAQAGIDDVALASAAAPNSPVELESSAAPPAEHLPPEAPPQPIEPAPTSDEQPPGSLDDETDVFRPLPPNKIEHAHDEGARDDRAKFFWGGGGKYQHFGSEMVGAVGPAAIAGVRVFAQAFVEGEFSPLFSLRRTEDFSATDLAQSVGFCLEPLDMLGGCVSGAFSFLHVRSPRTARPENDTSTSLGAEVKVRFIKHGQAADYLLSFGMRALARERRVLLNEDELTTIPRVQAFVSLLVRAEIAKP